jgi:hypothetical protein
LKFLDARGSAQRAEVLKIWQVLASATAAGLIAFGSAEATPAAYVVYQAAGSDAYLGAFDPTTGQREGAGGYLSNGVEIAFDNVGAVAFAPDGTPWVVYEGAGGKAILAAFDPVTLHATGQALTLFVGNDLPFDHVGGLAFASDGTPWLTYNAAGDAYLAAFDPTTGQREGPGAYLYNGANIAFEFANGLAFDSQDRAWLVYQSGGEDAYLAAFDPLTGHREGPGGYLYIGESIPFENVAGLGFDSEDTPWLIYNTGGGDAYLAAFDPTTGQREGPGHYLYIGETLPFDRAGALAFAPDLSTALAGVPEPGPWLMMIMGFGLAGGMIRRRRVVAALA